VTSTKLIIATLATPVLIIIALAAAVVAVATSCGRSAGAG
jgi:hypothetical protein